MRPVLVFVVLCAATLQLAAQNQFPRGQLYRGPHYLTRDAAVVEPEGGLPLEFTNSLLVRPFDLQTTVRSRSVRTILVSNLTLRVAFGPTPHGMITYRLRAPEPPLDRPEPLVRITPNGMPRSLRFSIVREDPAPGILALTPEMKIVFTIERIDGENGPPVFDNPEATELLWVALGRPSPNTP
jgi:hypothetical protein